MSEKEWQAQVDCLLKEVNEYGAEGLLSYEQGILWSADRIRELKAQLEEANYLISTMSRLIDNYYIEPGHRYIADHEDYIKKWEVEGAER